MNKMNAPDKATNQPRAHKQDAANDEARGAGSRYLPFMKLAGDATKSTVRSSMTSPQKRKSP